MLNELIEDVYINNSNYRIVKNSGTVQKGYCYIYCSSNGIFFPNSDAVFIETIKKRDRYEFENLRPRLLPEMEIYLRDVRKSWYVTGINKKINTIEKLIRFLKKITANYKLVTVGSSAGGYLAILLGQVLHAERVFSFCGQVSLYVTDCINTYHWLNVNKNKKSYKQFHDISDMICKENIIFFTSMFSENDLKQLKLIENKSNVLFLKFDTDTHGVPFALFFLPEVLCMSIDELREISEKMNRDGGVFISELMRRESFLTMLRNNTKFGNVFRLIDAAIRSNKQIAIYPYGKNGMLIHALLQEEYNRKTELIVDNNRDDAICFNSVHNANDYCWIVSTSKKELIEVIKTELQKNGVLQSDILSFDNYD